MQAFFWISFRLFPTLPPALLTATATDTAKPLPMLQKQSGLKQSSVTHWQGKPRRRHWFNKGIPNSLHDGCAVNYAGTAEGCISGCPRQLRSPGSAGLAAQEGEQQSWRQLSWQRAGVRRALPQTLLVQGSFPNNVWKAQGKRQTNFSSLREKTERCVVIKFARLGCSVVVLMRGCGYIF